MEIVTIILEGELQYKDSIGNNIVLKKDDVQVMSAGTGIEHSELNISDKSLKMLQLWIYPKQKDLKPRHQKTSLNTAYKNNCLQQIVSPDTEGSGAWINQNAWIYLSRLNKGKNIVYNIKEKNNGLYVFVLSGQLRMSDNLLKTHDAIRIVEADISSFKAEEETEFLLIEIPMNY